MSSEMVQEHDYSFIKERIFVSQSHHYFHRMSRLSTPYSFDISSCKNCEKAIATRVEKQHKPTSSSSKIPSLGGCNPTRHLTQSQSCESDLCSRECKGMKQLNPKAHLEQVTLLRWQDREAQLQVFTLYHVRNSLNLLAMGTQDL